MPQIIKIPKTADNWIPAQDAESGKTYIDMDGTVYICVWLDSIILVSLCGGFYVDMNGPPEDEVLVREVEVRITVEV